MKSFRNRYVEAIAKRRHNGLVMIPTGGSDPLRFTGDGIMQVGVIPFLLDETILDRALAD